MPHRVYAILPRTGLANRLFIWARAEVFAEMHNLPVQTIGWGHLHLGPWIRRERSKRYYRQFFKPGGNFAQYISDLATSKIGRKLVKLKQPNASLDLEYPTSIVFSGRPDKRDYFSGLREHRHFLRKKLMERLRDNITSSVDELPQLDVAVHVRRGDFTTLGIDIEDKYYLDTLSCIAEKSERQVSFSIFSDSPKRDLSRILDFPGTQYIESRNDILDMFAIANSRFIVTTNNSTFGFWAAFLSDAKIVLSSDHKYGPIRDDSSCNALFEGTAEELPSHYFIEPVNSVT
ncbi:MAG: alpha-1,2-fucosyltransferase [Planctomycetota bacterium]